MAARIDPRHVRARHQSMHHFGASAPWEDAAVLRAARDLVLAELDRHGPVAAWLVDDTAVPKKGQHSVGVAHQYGGPLGKPANCQVAVTVTLANEAVSVPAAYQLYLPESWAQDRRRRRAVGVPTTGPCRPKWQIAWAQIRARHAEGVPLAPVVAAAAYGGTIEFRAALTAHQIPYVLGIPEDTLIGPPGYTPPPSRRGRTPRHLRGRPRPHPIRLGTLVGRLPVSAWSRVTWREGTRGRMRSRFVALPVRPAPARSRAVPRPVEWLLSKWPLRAWPRRLGQSLYEYGRGIALCSVWFFLPPTYV